MPFLGFPLIFVLKSEGSDRLWVIGAAAVGLAVVAGHYWLLFRNAALLFDGQVVRYRDAVGRLRVVGKSGAGSAVRATVPNSGVPLPYFFWLHPDGHVALKLSERVWPQAELEALAGEAGYPVSTAEGTLSAREASQRWPEAFGWPAREPTKFALAFTGCLVTLGFIVTAIRTFG